MINSATRPEQPDGIHYKLHLQREAIYLSPLNKRCRWVPHLLAKDTFWFRYLDAADRRHDGHDDRADFALNAMNLHIMRHVGYIKE